MDPLRSLFRRVEPWLQKVRWGRWRAALLALHIFAVVLVAFPAPLRKLDDAMWQKPSMRSELRNWTARLRSIGLPVTEEKLQNAVTRATRGWQQGRSAVVGPFKTYLQLLAIPQNWYMFTGPDRAPQRFALSFTERDRLEKVFELGRSLDRPDLVHADFLTEHRVRRALFQSSWGRDGETFEQICAYWARHLRKVNSQVDNVVCELLVQDVIHPSHAERALASSSDARPVTVARTLVLRRDGTTATTLAKKAKKRTKKGQKP